MQERFVGVSSFELVIEGLATSFGASPSPQVLDQHTRVYSLVFPQSHGCTEADGGASMKGTAATEQGGSP
jgi:hypothetical protein